MKHLLALLLFMTLQCQKSALNLIGNKETTMATNGKTTLAIKPQERIAFSIRYQKPINNSQGKKFPKFHSKTNALIIGNDTAKFGAMKHPLHVRKRRKRLGGPLSSGETFASSTIFNGNASKGNIKARIGTSSAETFTSFAANEDLCRTRDGRYLPPDLFKLDTCASCYNYERRRRRFQWHPYAITWKTFPFVDYNYTIMVLVNATNFTTDIEANSSAEEIFLTVQDSKMRTNWLDCCKAAEKCCYDMISTPASSLPKYCPRTWDGWQCWKDTEPDTEAFEHCQPHVYNHTPPSCTKMASKYCTSGGTWFKVNGTERSIYSSCGIQENIRMRATWHVVALSISVAALTPALLIFFCFRQLRINRIALHKQLFISLLFESCCSISSRLIYSQRIQETPPWCSALGLIHKYSRLSTYMWYLCEGIYLHHLLASAFAEQRSIAIFYIIGWGFPFIPVILYALLRGLWYNDTQCWNIPIDGGLEWIIFVPPLIAILVNLIFMVNIIRILLSKVRASNNYEPSQYRMAVRATLMVIPLFGLQQIFTIYRPTGRSCGILDAYHIINNIIDGSTGFVVAVIFCYSNSEIKTLLKRSWRRFRQQYPLPFEGASLPLRSRTLSTVQTTLLDHSRRDSSLNRTGMLVGSKRGESNNSLRFGKAEMTSSLTKNALKYVKEDGHLERTSSKMSIAGIKCNLNNYDNSEECVGLNGSGKSSPDRKASQQESNPKNLAEVMKISSF